MTDDSKLVDLAARRRAQRRDALRRRLARYRPSYMTTMWLLLLAAAVAGYVLFGARSAFQNGAMTGGLQAGGIGVCVWRRHTCLVDGDTGWQDGIKWRMQGIDAPEMDEKAECEAERLKARAALDRLLALMADGYTVTPTGRKDRFGRGLVDVVLKDGRDAGRVLMAEGFAQVWPNSRNVWCSR